MTSPPRLLTARQSAIAGRNVRVLRVHAGWTQADLGKLVGLSVSRVSRMESGERLFSDEELILAAGLSGVAAADLLLPEGAECANCQGAPAPGFACLACGTETLPAGDAAGPLGPGSVPVGVFARCGRRRVDVSTADIVRMRDDERMSFPAISRKVGLSASGVKHRYAAGKREAG
jgi:DNA-binding transcriptional regulator YiaG